MFNILVDIIRDMELRDYLVILALVLVTYLYIRLKLRTMWKNRKDRKKDKKEKKKKDKKSGKKDSPYGVESVTDKGEVVQSKKEKRVADYLNSKGIKYEYEREINIDGDRMLTDFYLPDYDVYIEYWGLDKLQNDDGDEYRRRKAEKIALYDKHNLKLISINEDNIDDIENDFPKQLKALEASGHKVGGLKGLLFGKPQEPQFCTECGNNYTGAFCTNCGIKDEGKEEAKELFCTNCGKTEPAGTEFCSSCGNKMD